MIYVYIFNFLISKSIQTLNRLVVNVACDYNHDMNFEFHLKTLKTLHSK